MKTIGNNPSSNNSSSCENSFVNVNETNDCSRKSIVSDNAISTTTIRSQVTSVNSSISTSKKNMDSQTDDSCAINELLEGRMDLTVNLPTGVGLKPEVITINVDRQTAMMDLLVKICNKYKLKCSCYRFHIDNKDYKASTPIGSLDVNTISMIEKKNSSTPVIQIGGSRSNLTSTLISSGPPTPFPTTFRLQIKLPQNQLMVMRVLQTLTIGELKPIICKEKELDGDKFEILGVIEKKFNGGVAERKLTVLDPSKKIIDYGLNSVTLMSKKMISQIDVSHDQQQQRNCGRGTKKRPAPLPPNGKPKNHDLYIEPEHTLNSGHMRQNSGSDSSGYHESVLSSESPASSIETPTGRKIKKTKTRKRPAPPPPLIVSETSKPVEIKEDEKDDNDNDDDGHHSRPESSHEKNLTASDSLQTELRDETHSIAESVDESSSSSSTVSSSLPRLIKSDIDSNTSNRIMANDNQSLNSNGSQQKEEEELKSEKEADIKKECEEESRINEKSDDDSNLNVTPKIINCSPMIRLFLREPVKYENIDKPEIVSHEGDYCESRSQSATDEIPNGIDFDNENVNNDVSIDYDDLPQPDSSLYSRPESVADETGFSIDSGLDSQLPITPLKEEEPVGCVVVETSDKLVSHVNAYYATKIQLYSPSPFKPESSPKVKTFSISAYDSTSVKENESKLNGENRHSSQSVSNIINAFNASKMQLYSPLPFKSDQITKIKTFSTSTYNDD